MMLDEKLSGENAETGILVGRWWTTIWQYELNVQTYHLLP